MCHRTDCPIVVAQNNKIVFLRAKKKHILGPGKVKASSGISHRELLQGKNEDNGPIMAIYSPINFLLSVFRVCLFGEILIMNVVRSCFMDPTFFFVLTFFH